LRQYERAFRAYGIAISFEDEALRLMAQAAATEKTGARGLLKVWEKLFRDFKFYLAGSGISQLRVTAELVHEPKRVLDRLLAEGHKHEAVVLDQQIDVFSESFRRWTRRTNFSAIWWCNPIILHAKRTKSDETLASFCVHYRSRGRGGCEHFTRERMARRG